MKTEELSGINENVVEMLSKISNKINYFTDTIKMDEDTYTMEVVDPIVNSFLSNISSANISYRGCEYELPESKCRKTRKAEATGNNEKIIGRKPDRSAQATTERNRGVYNVFLSEIKTEHCYKNRPDLGKLGSMMKDFLDYALHQQGASNDSHYVIGLLIEGRMCLVYSLDLPCNGLYRMVEVDVFFLPTGIKDLNILSAACQPLLNLQALILRSSNLLVASPPTRSLPEEEMVVEGLTRLSCKSPPRYSEFYA